MSPKELIDVPDSAISVLPASIVAQFRGRAVVGLVGCNTSDVRTHLEKHSFSVVTDFVTDFEGFSQLDIAVCELHADDTTTFSQLVRDLSGLPVIAVVDSEHSSFAQIARESGAAAVVARSEICSGGLLLPIADCLSATSEVCLSRPGAGQRSVNTTYLTNHRQLEIRNRFLSALNGVAVSLMDKMELNELLQRIADTVIELSHCSASYISMVHESGEYLEMVASAGGFKDLKGFQHRRGQGVAGSAWESKEIVHFDNYQRDERALLNLGEIVQACAIPIFDSERVTGIIGIAYQEKDHQIRDQLDLLTEFSKLAAIAIENATLLDQTEIELKRTETTRQLCQAIYNSTSFSNLFDQISVALIDVFDLLSVSVLRCNASAPGLDPRSVWLVSDGRIKPGNNDSSELQSPGLYKWSLENQSIVNIDRGVQDPREETSEFQARLDAGIGAMVALPLVHDTEKWGLVVLHKRLDQRNFTHSDLNLLQVLGNQISTAIHRHGLLNKIQHQAYHDSLTNLPNRFQFEAVLHEKLSEYEFEDKSFALIFLDLDGFKNVNDTLGHAMGDELLKHISRRLARTLKTSDVLARMGGDEFAILLPDTGSKREAIDVASRLIDKLRPEFLIHSATIKIGASAGISFYPDDSRNADELLKNADIAMYQAKDNGKDQVHCFSQVLSLQHQRRIQLEQDLRIALVDEQFELYYQPQVNTRTGIVDSVEALIRWNHPVNGLISPAEFIPVAEESGFVIDLGDWVLRRACLQLSEWLRSGKCPISVSVNISAKHFNRSGFANFVLSTLAEHKVDPHLLHLEVTESVVMNDVVSVATTLGELREHGIGIAVDDFGTGYSSLQYLQDLPLDVLKIDRAFIQSLDTSVPKNSVANTIVYLANSFGLKTVAEGVETQSQLQCITDFGCDWIQGYFYSKPVPMEKLDTVIDNIHGSQTRYLRTG